MSPYVRPPLAALATMWLAAGRCPRHRQLSTLSSGPALPTLKAFAGSGHILFGTDSPYDHCVSAAFTVALGVIDSLNADDHTAISHGNAQHLFPRLGRQHGSATPQHRG